MWTKEVEVWTLGKVVTLYVEVTGLWKMYQAVEGLLLVGYRLLVEEAYCLLVEEAYRRDILRIGVRLQKWIDLRCD